MPDVIKITQDDILNSEMSAVAKGHLLNLLEMDLPLDKQVALLFWLRVWVDAYLRILQEESLGEVGDIDG